MTICNECGGIGGTHKMGCSDRPGRQAVVPMAATNAMTQAIARTPSLVALDNAEADIIAAARAMRHLIPPPVRMTTTEQMESDDRWYAAYHRLLDALDRAPEEGL